MNLANFSGNYVKRRTVSSTECKYDLKKIAPFLFQAFNKSVEEYYSLIASIPAESRGRGWEASTLNTKMIQHFQKAFPANWRYGKYKRFLLELSTYTIICKKLNKKGKPMNIKTVASSAIANQMQLSLFENHDSFHLSPIIIFGYQKDKFGKINSPSLTYIDEDKVKWKLTEIDFDMSIAHNVKPQLNVIKPKLKIPTVKKKVAE